ncbi:MAG: hypothetical protein ACFN4D_02460 [Cardiobacterium sp.]
MSFQPDFNHPDSQSWQRLIAWPGIIIFALAVIALPLASFIADRFVSGILHYLVMIALFMAILKALTPLHKYLTRICGNHTPAVICDHQGITFYNLRDRISHQWRWTELHKISYPDEAFPLKLFIETRDGTKTTIRFELELRAELVPEIAAVAMRYLQDNRHAATANPAPEITTAAPKTHTPISERCWYPGVYVIGKANLNIFVCTMMLAVIIILDTAILQYIALSPWLAQGLVVCSILFALWLCRDAWQCYRQSFHADRSRVLARADDKTLMVYPYNGRALSFYWTEIRSVKYHPASRYQPEILVITDRNGGKQEITIDNFGADIGKSIGTYAHAFLHNEPLPPPLTVTRPALLAYMVLIINLLIAAIAIWLTLTDSTSFPNHHEETLFFIGLLLNFAVLFGQKRQVVR